MGYEKEIILYKKNDTQDYSALELISSLHDSGWKPTLSLIDRGNDFDWIQLANNRKGHEKFQQIIEDKTVKNEYIGFQLQEKRTNRFVTVDLDRDKIIFSLDIGSNEDEKEWFYWYNSNLIPKLRDIDSKIKRIEWRTGYDNEVIKVENNRCI